MKNTKRILAMVLSVLMALTCLSGTVFAEETAEPDLTCYAEIDYTKYMEDHTAVYGYGNPNQTEVKLTTDQGYATFVSTGGDPNFVYSGKGFLSQIENVTSDKLDFIVIKYRTSENGRGEFYTGRSDGVQWASPMESSHVDWSYKTSGEWETVIVDASGVWGNVEGVTLNNFRFDYGGNCPGTFDVAYLRFYATREGAEACVAAEKQTVTETVTVAVDDAAITKDGEGNAFYGDQKIPLTYVPAEGDTAEHYTYEVSKTVVKAPEVPFNPANIDLRYVYDGMALAPSEVGNTEPVAYDFEKGCVTYVATGDDPQIYLDATGVEVGPYMAIKYRATNITTSDGMECFIGESAGPVGTTDNKQWGITADGEWQTAIIHIGDLADYNAETNVINHFRFDFLRGAKTSEGETMEIEYIAFFGDEDSANFYVENNMHEPPKPPKHTVTFVADGIDIAVLEFTEGDTQLNGVPEVPAKEGYEGKWEAYTLGTTDLTVNAVYTEKETEAPTEPADDPDETTQEPDEQPTEPAIEDPTEAPDGASTEAPTDGVTEPTEKKGCNSVIGMSAAALLAVAAAAVALKKKEN